MSVAVYRVQPVAPREHLFEVLCTVAAPNPAGQVFRLPSWIRGSYLVRDFAKHVVDLTASCGGQRIALERLDKRSLRCAPCAGPLQLRYRVYAFDVSVRKAYLDLRRGFFNGSSLFYRPEGGDGPFELELLRPDDAACDGWRVATAMRPLAVDADGFGRYRAEDYEELIDHPVEMGRFERLEFDVDGIPHALVLAGRCTLDRQRVTEDLQRICATERAMFGGEPSLPQYLFLTNVVGSGYGGLEHRSSTALICSRGDLPQPGASQPSQDYIGFLGLCSHEYFHLWNVKRITAQAFAESDLGAEAYTRDLWHYEGVTSYYDDLLLLRAGIIDAPRYLDLLSVQATRVERTPGAAVQSLADASFEAWTKHYQPDENTPNQAVSYYSKGALAALCLDLILRLKSTVTLDDVMRAAWQRWGRTQTPVPEGGLEQLAQSLSGLDLRAFFDGLLRSTDPLPLTDLLAEFGVSAQRRPAQGSADNGGRATARALPCTLGIKLRGGSATVATVYSESAAAAAAIHAGDQIVALDGQRVTHANWDALQMSLQPDQTVSLHLFRDDELMTVELKPKAAPADTWTLSLQHADGVVADRRRAWLGV
ncbi:M61 family metallopeptidase [Sinimarinibacterium sp. CAU 1509]|uniref:M61 family metallopeptidase n=1 Tax=Sinimarinibacterium sp. CAU 1509 TaxID=2562283 RepID=UPI0010AC6839|nr:PDZ domain-containing protein [Sinimarinibacterium sp. CAU 1509]TJY63192.1 M61 family metallopeptidase [Sinimarinibacterium sp. CAU 1509]